MPMLSYGQEQDSIKIKTPKSFAIYPAIGYSPETSLQLGVIGVWVLKGQDSSQTEFVRRSSLTPFALYTLKGQILTELSVDYFFKKGVNVNIAAQFFNYPDSYYGIGNENNPNVYESYTNIFGRINGEVYYPLTKAAFAGLTFNAQLNSIEDIQPGGMLELGSVNGIQGGRVFGLGPAFKFDNRNDAIYPTKGLLVTGLFRPVFWSDYQYASYSIDFRQYLTIKNDKNILAYNVNINFTSGSDIPFYKLPQLGGANRLRGISNASLYRDKQLFFTQVEYRRHIVWRIGLVAFLGLGEVASSVGEFDLTNFKYVTGLGYRFAVLKNQKLNFRFDFGVTNDGQTAFYVGMREAF